MRVMGDEEEGKGLGGRWEGHLIRQHIYNAGAENTRFLPVIFESKDKSYIPTPLQASTYYDLEKSDRYEDLYRHLTHQPRVTKPELGKLLSLSTRAVKTDPKLFLEGPIRPALWDVAGWMAVGVFLYRDRPPTLGLGFENGIAAREIFTDWHNRYGSRDENEEIRISIIEGDLPGEDPGYFIHVGMNLEVAAMKFEETGFNSELDLWLLISRVHRMHPDEGSKNLELFKEDYQYHKRYNIAPFILAPGKRITLPINELAILKTEILFRNVSDIDENDIDRVVLSRPDKLDEP
jgi:hypothetical protein